MLHVQAISLINDDCKMCSSVLFVQEVNSVYRILAAILNTGNIEFTSTTSQHQTDKSEVPNSEALENSKSLEIC